MNQVTKHAGIGTNWSQTHTNNYFSFQLNYNKNVINIITQSYNIPKTLREKRTIIKYKNTCILRDNNNNNNKYLQKIYL